MRVVFASHTAKVGVFRVGSHHLSREFSLAGNDVSHASSAVTLAHLAKARNPDVRARFRLALRGPKLDEAGVRHGVPLTALPPSLLPLKVSEFQTRHPLRSWTTVVGAHERVDVLLIDQPSLGPVIDVLKPRVVIYRPTDAHFDSVTRAAEIAILKRAHAVVATSEVVLNEVTKHMSETIPSLVLENGVDFAKFSVPRTNATRNGVVYLGALDKRFGWDALIAMALGNPQVPFRIAGPTPTEMPKVLPLNIEMLGPVAYDDAPALLQSARVGILPFSNDKGNKGRSPMKFYEYLAAGLSVVASASPTLMSRSAPNVWLYERPEEAPSAIAEALQADSPNTDGVSYAESFGWPARARSLAEFAESLLAEQQNR